jgi:DNA-binding MarR family transcriptional regulator
MHIYSRKEKVQELFASFDSLRRAMAFGVIGSAKMPPITPSQWGALMMIEQRGESTLKDVAKALGVTSSAATQLVEGLVRSGYVVRGTHAKDRRAVVLTLSKKTRTHINAMKKQAVQKSLAIFEMLDDTEFDQYILLTKKIVERFLKNKNI